MHPEEHLKDLEHSRRLRKIWRGLILAAMLFSVFYFAGPLVHEASHILVLELSGCSYSQFWSFSASGLGASIQPLCTLGNAELVVFYSVGYLSMILVGGVMGAIGIERHNSFLHDQVLTVGAIGFLLSLVTTIETEGDLRNILDLLGLDPVYGDLVSLLVFLGSSSVIYLLVHNFIDQNGSAAARGRS